MKSVLKRRKHRKGIRPVRKGTLKVNLQELPTWESLAQGEGNLLKEYGLILHKEGNQAHKRRMSLLNNVLFMQRAFRFLDTYKQINPDSLILAAINESMPGPCKQKSFDKTSVCLVCLHNCPYASKNLAEDKLIRRCPILRCAFQDHAIEKHVDNQYTLLVDQAAMAELALTHLS